MEQYRVCFCFKAYQAPQSFNEESSKKIKKSGGGTERSVMLEFISRKMVYRKFIC